MAKINQYPAKTVPSNNDEFVLHDPASGSTKKMTRGDLIGGAPLPAKSVTLPAINGGTTAGVLTTNASGDVSIKSPKIGIIPASTFNSTGAKNITGVGFKPSLVEFTVLPSNAGTNLMGTGAMSADAQFYVTAGTQASSYRASGTDAAIAYVNTSNGSIGFAANYGSMNADGFTINVTTAGVFPVAYKAHP